MKRFAVKRFGKRILSAICSVAVICSGMPVKAEAAYADIVDYMKTKSLTFYVNSDDHTIRVKGYNKYYNESPYVMVLPGNWHSKDVTYHLVGIANAAFNYSSFSTIYISSQYGLSIGNYAF